MVESAHTVVISDHKLYYRVMGQGEPLVLIHGYGTSGYVWQRVLPYLCQNYRVFVLDLPGYGRSAAPRSWRLRAIAPVIAAWLHSLHLPPVAVIGHSMGGAIAIHLTALAPETVRKLVLVDAAGLPLSSSFPTLALRAAYSMIQPGNGRYPLQMVLDAVQPRFRVLWQTSQEMLRSDLRLELASITSPTLIIWGERDALLPIALGYALNAALPHAMFVSLSGCGHRPMLAQPERFSHIVLDFLQAHDTPAQG
ncbi:dihydrolipoamide acetyltransferase [Reticulibacter mediterranei]|uniref:Dihydrolipoamide acetyltransferase n=1 Tax=Reticulibacter mediterranei TaxID=2778369 RepID=A0A8J3IPE0_9CHLR|nr:alpha/beta hydrolase [Reticulibacter mediterranei]GHO94470.1 dihydrolipoamide acetyltransferase [Reticulibacter mediterranei]